jgi:conjugative transposon TraN protein
MKQYNNKFFKKAIIVLILSPLWVVEGLAQVNQDRGGYTTIGNNVALTGNTIHQATIPLNSSTVFVSPEPILYVDISNNNVHGDMPNAYNFRLKADTTKVHAGENFTVTIVTKAFVSVYRLYLNRSNNDGAAYVISLNPNDAVQTQQAEALSNRQAFEIAMRAYNNKRSIYNIKSKAYGMEMRIKNIYAFGEYILLDIVTNNNTKIQFSVEQMRFKIIDKHVLKATVSQDIEVEPVYTLFPIESTTIGKRTWRNIVLLKKFTFPTQKLFQVELNEKQYSGRKILLRFEYTQLLRAAPLPPEGG